MKEESFEQKRIVQLSRELDAQRDKYARLVKDSNFLSAKLKEAQEEIEQNKQKLIEYQINNHQLAERMRETERESLQLKDQLDREQKLRSQAEVQNVRQRQKIDELKQEMTDYENKTKAILYERTNQLADKDRQIYKLKQENLEIQKLYLNQRERLQRKEEKHLRELTRLFQQFEALKKELASFKAQTERAIQAQKRKHTQDLKKLQAKIDQLERRLRKQEQLQAQIEQMKMKLEDVVIENSQKIIELYKYKYA